MAYIRDITISLCILMCDGALLCILCICVGAHRIIFIMGLLWRNFAKCLDNQLWARDPKEKCLNDLSSWLIAVRQSVINGTQFYCFYRWWSGRQIERCARVFFSDFVLITIRKIGTRQSYIVEGYFKSAAYIWLGKGDGGSWAFE